MDAYCVFVLKRRSFLFVIDRQVKGEPVSIRRRIRLYHFLSQVVFEPIERDCSIGSAVICRFIIFGST